MQQGLRDRREKGGGECEIRDAALQIDDDDPMRRGRDGACDHADDLARREVVGRLRADEEIDAVEAVADGLLIAPESSTASR